MTSDSPRQISRLFVAALSAAAGFLLFHFFGNASKGYIPTDSLFVWWGTQWLDPASETEHGWIILGLSLWLLWRNLRLQGGGIARSSGGVGGWGSGCWAAWYLAAFGTHALGYFTQQARLSIVGLLLFVWALLGQSGGRRWARAAVFPVAFLSFAIPLNFLDSAGFWLRLTIVRSASLLADCCGWPVLVQGARLVSPDGGFYYEVDYACAGVRSLVAILALSLVLGYVRLRPAWARAAMVVVALPLTYAANVLRMMAIIGAGHYWGQKAGGVVHDVGGYVVFIAVLGAVHSIAGLFEKFEGRGQNKDVHVAAGLPVGAGEGECGGRTRPVWHGCIIPVGGSLVLMGLLALGARYFPEAKADVLLAPDQRNPVELPAFPKGDWIGRRAEVSVVERQILPPDTGFSRRIYVSAQEPGRPVLVSVVLSGRDRSSIHRPEICLIGQGWTIGGGRAHTFRHPARFGNGFEATLLRLEQQTKPLTAAEPQLAAYWFVGGGRVVRTHWARIGWDVWGRLCGRPVRWAYVMMMTSAPAGEEEAVGRMQGVLDAVLPSFQPPL